VFDACYSADLTLAAREYCGLEPAVPPPASAWSATWHMSGRQAGPTTLDRLKTGGVRTVLIAETGSSLAGGRAFDQSSHIAGNDSTDAAPADRPFSRLMAAAVEHLRAPAGIESSLVWLGSRGVPSPWQPPREIAGIYWEEFFDAALLAHTLAAALGDDDSAFPGPSTADPESWLARAVDRLPAAGLFRRGLAPELEEFQSLNRLVYAAGLSAIDAACGALRDGLDAASDDVQLIVAAAAGELLVEHPCVARGCPPIIDALSHVPLIIRCGKGEAVGSRRSELVSTADVAATLVDWFHIDDPSPFGGASLLPITRCERETIREEIVFGAEQVGWGVRTPEFCCLCADESVAPGAFPTLGRPWLFQKPDDVADVVDVADQYPAESDSLFARLRGHVDMSTRAFVGPM
jgi:arylsulfatase A-like enzyme